MSQDFSSTFKVCDPDNVQMTLTVTMSIGDWKRLTQQLPGGNYPSWKLNDAIRDFVARSERVLFFDSTNEEPPNEHSD